MNIWMKPNTGKMEMVLVGREKKLAVKRLLALLGLLSLVDYLQLKILKWS